MGFQTGEKIGQIIEIIREAQLNNKIQNKQAAINFLKELNI